MKLISLKFKNFMPYKEPMTLNFPTDGQRNVMLIFGDNMRGKTSIMNAIRWCLYAKAIGRHSKEIPLQDIINRDAAKEGEWEVEVILEFETQDHKYELRRNAKKNKYVTNPSKPEDFDTTVFLKRDGEVVSGDQIKAEINKFAPEPVSRFFLFDGELLGEYEELLQEGSNQGKNIKEAIEQVLGVPALTNGSDQLAVILKAAIQKQTTDLKKKSGLERLAKDLEKEQGELESLQKDINALKQKKQKYLEMRSDLDEELNKVEAILKKDEELKSLRTQYTRANDTIKEKRDRKHEILKNAWKDMLAPKLKAKRNSLQKQRDDIRAEEEKLIKLETTLELHECTQNDQICSICGQQIPETEIETLKAKIAKFQSAFNALKEKKQTASTILAQLTLIEKIEATNAIELLEEVETDIRKAEITAYHAETAIEVVQDEIRGQDTATLKKKRVDRDEYIREETRIADDISDQEVNEEKTKQKIAELSASLSRHEEALGSRSSIKVGLVNSLADCFKRSIDELREKLRTRVESLADESFKQMTTQERYQGLTINENYGLSIMDSNGDRVNVRSAGAEQVVALALIDGLNRTGRSKGPVVMDTPFGRLDLHHRDNILRYLPTVTSQFILLVHEGEIRPETDLVAINDRIGARYIIKEISENQSTVERWSQ